jgi:hypothetical protein
MFCVCGQSRLGGALLLRQYALAPTYRRIIMILLSLESHKVWLPLGLPGPDPEK